MRRQLYRLLRVREILEDLSHLNFAGKAAEMHDLEVAAEKQRELALSIRSDALFRLTEEEPAKREAWSLKMADAEICSWRKAKLGDLASAHKPSVNRAHEELLARRVDRLQTEILHANAMRAEKRCQDRREQNRTDDWFQSRSVRWNRQQK
jgi:hypothetical protein